MQTDSQQLDPQFLRDLPKTEFYRTWQADRAKEKFAARQVDVDRLATMTAKRDRDLNAHRDKLAPLETALASAKAAYDAARQRHDTQLRVLREAEHEHEVALRRVRRGLEDSADPRIEAAITEMWRRYDSTRNELSSVVVLPAKGFDEYTLKPLTRTLNNSKAITRLLEAMKAARAALEALKLENPADVGASIASILKPVERAWKTIHEVDA